MDTKNQELVTLADTAIARISALKVTTVEERTQVAYELKVVQGFRKELEDARVAEKEPHLNASREVDAKYKPVQDRLRFANEVCQKLMLTFDTEQARLHAAEQARLQEIALREQARFAAQAAEVERKAREKAEALRKEAEAAIAAGHPEEAAKLAARAQATEDKAEAKAGELVQRADTVIVPILAQQSVKISGQSTLETFYYEVVDAGLIPRVWMIPNDKALSAHARNTKGLVPIPGIAIHSKSSIRSGS